MSQDSVFACINCGRVYNHTRLKNCPGCSESSGVTATNRYVDAVGLTPEAQNEILLRQIANGVNRTTYAVRAMVSLFAILLMTGTIVAVFLALASWASDSSASASSGGFVFMAWLVGTIGTLTAYYQFFKEWALSRVH